MARKFTVKEYAAQFDKLPKEAVPLLRRELDADMNRLAAYTRRTKFRRGARRSTSYAVSRSGALESSVRPMRAVLRGGTRLEAGIRMGGRGARHAPFVEYGTRPHVIRAKQGRMLRFELESGAVLYRREVRHPGSRPRRIIERSVKDYQRNHFRNMSGAFEKTLRRLFA